MRILVNEFCGHPFQMELSRELARRGHHILHVYFADNHSTPKGDTEAAEHRTNALTIQGLHISMKFSKHSLRTRRKVDIAYGRAVAAKVAAFRPDIVISANMPLDAQRVLQQEARQQKARFIFWLQDVYSSAVRFVLKKKMGPLSGAVGAYYELLEKRLLRRSDGVVCIAPEFAEIAVKWGVEPSRIFVIENWAPQGEILPTNKDNAWACEHGVGEEFCFMYSGTLGMKHRPELLQALAQDLEICGDARLVVIADGAGADWLREKAKVIRKDVLKILPFQPYKRLSEVFGSSDVLIGLLDSEAGAFAVPSKILSYLCAGRTLMLAAPLRNHAAAVVARADAGVVTSPDSTSDFVKVARSLMENAELRSRYSANARAYAERSFNIARIADHFLEAFAGVEAACGDNAKWPQIEEPPLGDEHSSPNVDAVVESKDGSRMPVVS
jgi:colanic acid biosynthesis glycosyl transferase WcaI